MLDYEILDHRKVENDASLKAEFARLDIQIDGYSSKMTFVKIGTLGPPCLTITLTLVLSLTFTSMLTVTLNTN